MKFQPLAMAYLILLVAVSLIAQEDKEQESAASEPRERLEFRRESRPEGQRYSFEDYIQDLTAAARSDEPKPDNPVSQLASNAKREYQPLNPMTIFRW
ncbi:MAG: hypothetical protein ACREQP_08615 [Candidatus Binatia bacterium]